MKFEEKLGLLLDQSGATKTHVAKVAGISSSDLSKMANGTRRPYLDQGVKIARALKVPLEFLADDEIGFKSLEELEQEMELIKRIKRMGVEMALARLDDVPPKFGPPKIPNQGRNDGPSSNQ